MRPIPAPRLGDTHGLLRAISSRERVRLDEFITEFSIDELFPPGLENALGRTRQFVSFARSAGLLKEDRGVVELTEVGKRYVRSGDDDSIFDVSSGQAEWLRRQLFERHMTDSIYHGVAIGLSLYASNPPDFHVSRLDFGRALAHLGRAGWDNENTLESQGERYTTFLRDLELLDDQSVLTEIGNQTRSELTLPVHMSLRDLAGQLNPGGPDAATAEGEAEWAAAESAAAEEPAAEEPAAEAPAAAEEPAAVEESPPAIDTGEYEDVAGAAAAGRAAATEQSGRPIPPSDIWETAAPDEVTRAYSSVSPEDAAAASVSPPGEVEEPVADEPAPAVTSGDPLAAGTTSGDPLAEPTDVDGPGVESAAEDGPAAEAPMPVVEVPTGLAEDEATAAEAGGVAEAAPGGPAEAVTGADEPVAGTDDAFAGLAEPGVGAEEAVAGPGEAVADADEAVADEAVAGPGEPGAGAEEAVAGPGAGADEAVADEAVAGADEAAAGPGEAVADAGEAGTDEAVAGADEAVAGPGEAAAGAEEPAAGAEEVVAGPDEAAARAEEPVAGPDEAGAGMGDADETDAGAAAATADAAAAAALAAGVAAPPPSAAPEAPVPEPGAGPAGAAAEEAAVAEAALAETSEAAPVAASTRAPSGFLDAAAVKAAAEADGLKLPDSVYAAVVAALATGKHVVVAGPAGSGKTTLALAIAKAAVQAGRSEGAALATASPKWTAHDTVGRVGESGFTMGHVLAAAGKKKWLLIDEIDRAKLDKAFGDLSSFLGGLPLSLPDGSREVAAPKDWRIVATRDSTRPAVASAALLRRFAEVQVPWPDTADLEAAIDAATEGDASAAAVVKRLLGDESLAHLGAGAFLDAARYAAERNAISPASEEELEREIRAAYLDPHVREDDD